MKIKKLLFAACAVIFVSFLSFNISSSVKTNSHNTGLESLNIIAIANAEVTTDNTGPKKTFLGHQTCKCEIQTNCTENN